jgi:aspartate kinase
LRGEKVFLHAEAERPGKARCWFLRSQEAFPVAADAFDFSFRQAVVIKLGGSIFTGPASYGRAARFIAQRLAIHPEENLVVVVSAQNGETDALLREAEAIAGAPADEALDLLWSTGELRSVARLALHLQAAGIRAAALDVQRTGLRIGVRGLSVARAEFNPASVHAALAVHRVVIVPGFLATDNTGATVTLGRGGSDLTAVLLAAGLGAGRCELIKDVPGYFTDDPNVNRGARHIPSLSFARALAMAEDGCDLVQRTALEAAKQCSLPIVVRSLDENAAESWITAKVNAEEKELAEAMGRQVEEANLSIISTASTEN